MTRGLMIGLATTGALALASAVAFAGPKSGLQVGDKAGPYNVRDVTGPAKGTSLCYR